MKHRLEIIKESERFRTENGLSSGEPIKIKSLLLKLNIQTFFLPLKDNISGMSVKAGDFKFMLINSNHSIGRQNFTILHECYHLCIQKDFDSRICSTGKFDTSDQNELKADWFAAFVLMPEKGIAEIIPEDETRKNKIKITTLLYLEQYYGCSRRALLHRLNEMNLVSEDFMSEYKDNVKSTAILYGYDIKIYESGRENMFIGDYGSTAKGLYDKELISDSHFISLMQDIGKDIDAEGLTVEAD
jgi:Zn-dependent peptidase ImmA (M78 family)